MVPVLIRELQGYRVLLNIQRLAPGYIPRHPRASTTDDHRPRGAARRNSADGADMGAGMQFTSAISVEFSGGKDEVEIGDELYEPAEALKQEQDEKVAGPSRWREVG